MKLKMFAAVIALLVASAAKADQLFVCQSCTNPAGGDPNLISNPGNFNIGLAGAGHIDQTGLLVIIGVYDGSSATPAPMLTFGTQTFSPDGVGDWGESTDHVQLTSGDAYVASGFHDINGGNSETFANWNLGEAKAGIAAATSFELFAYDLPIALIGNTTVSLSELGAGKGSFIIAFSCGMDGPTAESGAICADGNISDTPFTNAGLVSTSIAPTPEISTLLMVSLGLFVIAAGRKLNIVVRGTP